MKFTYTGGPTALFELGGLRLLIDPTFDPAGEAYPTTAYTLRKTAGPALSPDSLGRIDAVLLSHDHHFDNLDNTGRALLGRAGMILTTKAGAERLGAKATGLDRWQHIHLPNKDGRKLRVTGTPARHGPVDGDRGPVTGFVLALTESPISTIYISGGTVWYEGVAEVSRRFSVQILAYIDAHSFHQPISKEYNARAERVGFNQLQVDLAGQLAKHRLAAPKDYRMDIEPEFIDQAKLHEGRS